MCGLIGATGAAVSAEVEAGLRLILHRGPDGAGIVEAEGIALGHCRLAVIDPGNGTQPLVDDSGRYVLVYNGEIYNYRDLRRLLEQQGQCFRSDSDTEVLLAWMVRYGIDGLMALSGMFAFALWDRRERRLLLARDRLGIKPLYLTRQGDDVAFASEIKGLLPFLGQVTANPSALFQYLTYQQVMNRESFFAGVERLGPGEWLQWHAGTVRRGHYWTPEPAPRSAWRDRVEQYREALDRAIARHLVSDVPIGCYLSSGIDSSSVATLSAAAAERPLIGFVGAFTEAPYYDERPGARQVARAAGMDLEEVVIGPRDFTDNLAAVGWHLDEPTLGSGALPQYILAARAARSVRVVLTGHGGDELFAGYQVNKAVMAKALLARPHRLPCFLAQLRADELARVLYFLLFPLVQPEVACGMYVMVPKRQRSAILSADFLRSTGGAEPLDEVARITAGRSAEDGLLQLYLRTYLQTLLIQEDKVGMAHGLEARMPLCDNELLDLSLELSLEDKLKGGRLKGIPRAAMRSVLPAALFDLPKRGFPTPLSHWFRGGPARDLIMDLLSSPRTLQRGVFLRTGIDNLVRTNDRSRGDGLTNYARATKMYSLAMLELWFRLYVDGDGGKAFAAPDRDPPAIRRVVLGGDSTPSG